MTLSTRLLPFCLLTITALVGCDKAATPAPAAEPVAPALSTPEQKMGYGLGITFGRQFHNDKLAVDIEAVSRGMRDGYLESKPEMTDEEVKAAMTQLQQAVGEQRRAEEATRTAEMGKAAERNSAEAAAFLTKNATAEGVMKTASGLQYKILTAGSGPKPGPQDSVSVHYRGTLLDGTEFDSSYARGEPVSFPVTGVIPGWVEALQLMPVGSKWTLYVPSELAYGPGGAGNQIGPNAMLLFDVELLAIEPK